ncbi:thiamine-phosphate synthase family protein [Thermosulfurimonas dismutans]|nr:thiamine-phosphate synthase family protein [Thermosulfurimonas dismutans]
MMPPIVCVIAGSDPSGAAGLQMDLRVLSLLGVYGTSIPTAFTVQGLDKGIAWEPSPPDLFEKALQTVFSELPVKVVKCGMLGTAEVALKLAEVLPSFSGKVIIDPILSASSGLFLSEKKLVSVLRERLFPLATLVTPNIPEAEALLGLKINPGDEPEAVKALKALGPQAVLLKGGHRKAEKVQDFFFDGYTLKIFEHPRLEGNFRGTGCFLASAIAGLLAQDKALVSAVEEAISLLELALYSAQSSNIFPPPANALVLWERLSGGRKVLEDLMAAVEKFVSHPVRPLIPEVQSNLAYALPYARKVSEVAAFPGRIVGYGNSARPVGCPRFGASSHVARIVLTAMRFEPSKRAALNIRFDRKFIEKAQNLGLKVGWFSRRDEPEEIKAREGGTLSWGVRRVIQELGLVPDLIADEGDLGKEPMIRILAEDPFKAVEIALSLL